MMIIKFNHEACFQKRGTKWMLILIKDEDLLEKYDDIWSKVGNNMEKEFDSKHLCNKNFLKTKIKIL